MPREGRERRVYHLSPQSLPPCDLMAFSKAGAPDRYRSARHKTLPDHVASATSRDVCLVCSGERGSCCRSRDVISLRSLNIPPDAEGREYTSGRSESLSGARAILSRGAALDSRGACSEPLSAVTTSSGRRPIGCCAPGRREVRSRIVACARPRSVAASPSHSRACHTCVYVYA